MITLTTAEAKLLVSDARKEIENSHNDAWNDITTGKLRRSQYEPQFVARLCASASNIANRWRPQIKRIDPTLTLSLASVFTHQTPCVTWPPSRRCELADLLIAIIDRTKKRADGMAVLIQAKQSDTGSVHLTTPSEKTQFDLLSGRPVFDVDVKPPAVAPVGVDLTGMTPDDALQYGLTPPDATPAKPSSWSTDRWTMADGLAGLAKPYHITAHPSLAEWMVEQLQSKRGWKFDLPPAGKDWQHFTKAQHVDDWSALINYLLQSTFKLPLTQLAFSGAAPPRGVDEALYFMRRSREGRLMFAAVNSDPRQGRTPAVTQWVWWLLRPGWRRVSSEDFPWAKLSGDGGRGGDGERAGRPELEPESGPISAIVFEIGKRGAEGKPKQEG